MSVDSMDLGVTKGNSMIVHPAYHPESGLWFLESGEEAPSLAKLKALLPAGTKILGYYPKGYSGKVQVSKAPTRTLYAERFSNYSPFSKAPKQIVVPPEVKPVVKPSPAPPVVKRKRAGYAHNRQYDHEAILNLWAEGLTGPQIAEKLGMDRWLTVCQIVYECRKKGDPRAVRRAPERIKW